MYPILDTRVELNQDSLNAAKAAIQKVMEGK